MELLNVINHPLLNHKLSIMRNKDTDSSEFRRRMIEIGKIMASEMTRYLPEKKETINTPLTQMDAPFLKDGAPALISILRAGNGLLDGISQILTDSPIGHIGVYRQDKGEGDIEIVDYYIKLPELKDRWTFVLDPMLATGFSASYALKRVKEYSPFKLAFVSLLAAPEGIELIQSEHPDVPIFVGAVDQNLNKKKYIVPGLGDAGDRYYGTSH